MPSNKRLTEAFRALRRMGLTARQNYGCCQSCGLSEIYAQVISRIKQGYPVPLGIVFYHGRDTDDRDEYKDFYLTYGDGDPDRDDTPVSVEEVGRRVVAVLYDHGIETDWDGDSAERIKVIASSLWHDDPTYLAHKAAKDMREQRLAELEERLRISMNAKRTD